MKTIPPICTEPETGPKYWRSLDQLAETPEFRQWVEREFPSGASECTDPVSRRNFVKLMSASFLLAGLGTTGCRRPVEHIYPFAKMPENYVHGVPQYFATAVTTRRKATPLVVKSNDGRPTKIEGNPDLPGSNGGTDHLAQASLLSLYDPDRAMRCAHNGAGEHKSAALDYLSGLSKTLGDGSGLAFLLEQNDSPSRARLQQAVAAKFPAARWHVFEPVDLDLGRAAASLAYSVPVEPFYKLDQASVIFCADCDFIGSEDNAYANIRDFAKGRTLDSKDDSLSRLYAVESLFTLTGLNADHRLRVTPGMVVAVLARLAINVLSPSDVDARLNELAAPAQPHDAWITECAKDLKANAGKSLVLGGYRLPLAAHLLVVAINEALGAVGHTVEFHQTAASKEGTLAELATALNGGQVQTLVILACNPNYNAPVDLNWPQAQAKAKTVIRLGYYQDETSWNATTHSDSQWDLPMAHYLESWGDGRTADGTYVPIQPLIEPLFGGITELEVLALIGGLTPSSPYEIVRETFRAVGGDDENNWRKFLHDGFLAGSASSAVSVQHDPSVFKQAIGGLKAAPAASKESLEVVFYRDSKMDDGRNNNNGWLQELPDPITKLTWDNAVLISPATAKELGVFTDRNAQNQKFFNYQVEVTLNGRTISGPVWIQPGMADHTVGLALGYGREKTGRVGTGAGFNAYKLRVSDNLYYASGASVKDTGDNSYELATTQSHWSMEGRPVVRETSLEQYRKNPNFAQRMKPEEPTDAEGRPVVSPLYPNPLDKTKAHAMHQWGMSIDLNRCVGCSACMIACQSENNIPIVGKEMVGKSREMHWIRLDRYYAGPVEDPQAVAQPMLCQHCESAPCESVCPVNATSHDDEGLNVMTYNRCVGTRYCSNNCPYKVRRFNFFDYNRHPLDHKHLYSSPLVAETDGEWELMRWLKNPDKGNLPEDQWQLSKLVKNPDVTVRMRGVMEKCTLCLQRIEQAKIAAKVKARDSDHIRLSEKEGTVPKTACQQACPAGAIIFGDISDSDSSVSKAKEQERTYKVLEFLLTKPRLTYLAKVRNPNPEMPDYKEHSLPYTTEDFNKGAFNEQGDSEEPAEKGAR
ncbi:MAG TPA: TAT-variant-translocated molybdopterin oxidoreductase [Verrucomicrobiae bacterium]|nr:TAT-variant-translocated molybdopterin oxidoreductase [Verrucomicrobiae bacterium]